MFHKFVISEKVKRGIFEFIMFQNTLEQENVFIVKSVSFILKFYIINSRMQTAHLFYFFDFPV